MQIEIISLFPEMFNALQYGVVGRGIEQGLLSLNIIDPRSFTTDKYKTVDDRPYGGGPGMVMKVQPLRDAILAAKKHASEATVVLLSPQGKAFNHAAAQQFSQRQQLILIAGRYEGVDERLIERYVDEEWSIGDYVLSGGELAAMVIIDAIARLIPGLLGHEQSAQQDSFNEELLDCPHYTRPAVMDEGAIPTVLQNGDHQAIARWRLKQALGRTWLRRPDLLEKKTLTTIEQQLLNEFISERKQQ